MDNLRKLWRLSRQERWVLLEALSLLPLTALALRCVGFRRWQSALARLSSDPARPSQNQAEPLFSQAQAIARIVEVAARRGPYRAACLAQSLVLWWLLRRRGIKSDLQIGVRKDFGGPAKAGPYQAGPYRSLEAHAWVELLGLPLNGGEPAGERFERFDRAITPPNPKTA